MRATVTGNVANCLHVQEPAESCHACLLSKLLSILVGGTCNVANDKSAPI